MNSLYPAVAERAEHRCEYCRAPEAVYNFRYEVEHIAPQASGGTHDLENLALSCRACNAFKQIRTSGVDPESGELMRLFHPRRDLWTEHFRFVLATQEILGRTAVGRATVQALRLNEEFQRTARRHWVTLELFP